ncbi:MAG: hypothetical protein ACRDRL_27385 [Sciscionella sp.]
MVDVGPDRLSHGTETEQAGASSAPREADTTHPLTVVLRAHIADLGHALDTWSLRDDTKPQPEVRRAANTAIEQIDAMLAELYRLRMDLTGEMRSREDATMARTTEMLGGDR